MPDLENSEGENIFKIRFFIGKFSKIGINWNKVRAHLIELAFRSLWLQLSIENVIKEIFYRFSEKFA